MEDGGRALYSMTLRDVFAALAPAPPWWLTPDSEIQCSQEGMLQYATALAAWRLAYADEMLKARDEMPDINAQLPFRARLP